MDLKLYVVTNSVGQYYSPSGKFVDYIMNARIYGKLGYARWVVTTYSTDKDRLTIQELVVSEVREFMEYPRKIK